MLLLRKHHQKLQAHHQQQQLPLASAVWHVMLLAQVLLLSCLLLFASV
jgi:hypothetical protein